MFLHYKSWASENKYRGFGVYLIRPGFSRDTNSAFYDYSSDIWFDWNTIVSYQVIEVGEDKKIKNQKTYCMEIGLTNGSCINLNIWGEDASERVEKILVELHQAVLRY